MLSLPPISPNAISWTIHGVGSALLVGIGLALELLVIAPMRQHSEEDRVEIEQLEQRVALEGKIRREFRELRAALKAQKQKQRGFRERLPSDPLEAEFLAQVARLAEEVGLNVRDYRPGQVTPRGDYAEVDIELSGEGSYESICRFLYGLSQIPRLSSLAGLEIQAGSEEPLYPIRMNFSAYFVPMKSESGS